MGDSLSTFTNQFLLKYNASPLLCRHAVSRFEFRGGGGAEWTSAQRPPQIWGPTVLK